MANTQTASAEMRRWKKELQLSHKREKDWREDSEKIVKRYRGEEKKRNRFNVLWSNTETLRPAIYNSKANPDVRRRFRDSDPIGKAVGEVLERSLFVLLDQEESENAIKNDVLDGLLSGRGITRVRYVAQIKTTPKEQPEEDEGVGGSLPGEEEELEMEGIELEHVDWRDFRHGYGRIWDEVPWVGFRHKLTRVDAEAKFNKDDIRDVKFAQANVEDPKKETDQYGETGKLAEFWEIWDKEGKTVFFLQEDLGELLYPKDNPTGAPPLDFLEFFPCPEPLKLVENTSSLIPVPPFKLYEEQANELDKISQRIDKLVGVCRLRGVYDAKVSELSDLMTADDRELIPTQNAQAWIDKGLDAAITWMPVEQLKAVLEALYDARERQIAIIDQLAGVSDIVRGATDPEETATAQQLKSGYISIRRQRMQQEVQRYIRDLLRLASQVMAAKFSAPTFAQLTDLKFPSAEDKQRLAIQIQQAEAQGQPPPVDPALLQMPTWDDILNLLHSPKLMQFRVDVETDSTVAAMLNQDITALAAVLDSVAKTMQEFAPAVMAGSLPIEALKEIIMAVIRRAKLGMAVEDAFDKMKPPQPQPNKEAQAAQIKAESDQKIAGMKMQGDVQAEQAKQAAQAQERKVELEMELQKAHQEAQIELQKDAQEKQHELALKTLEHDQAIRIKSMELENERLIADANNQTKIEVAEIQAKAALDAAAQTAAAYEKQERTANA